MESIEKNIDPTESNRQKLERARSFSLFELIFENPSFPRSKIGKLESLEKFYEDYDKFINAAYLRGLELNNPMYVDEVAEVFVKAHQSGFSFREFVDKMVDPEIRDFFKKHGKKFLDYEGLATEEYKHWTCRMRTEN